MPELLKIKYRGIYLEINIDDKFSANLENMIDWLTFLKNHIKPETEGDDAERGR